MTIGSEDQRKQAFELFIRALAAAPDSLAKSLTGKNTRSTPQRARRPLRNIFFRKPVKPGSGESRIIFLHVFP